MQTASIPGAFCDVTYHMGEVYIARMHDQVHVDRWDGTAFQPVTTLPCGGNGFPRLRSVDGSLWLTYRPQDGITVNVHNLSDGAYRQYGGTFYNWPVALGPVGYAVNSIHEEDPNGCKVYHYDDGSLAAELPWLPGTGIAYLDGFNRVVSNDQNRLSAPPGSGMINPEWSDGLVAGENTDQPPNDKGVVCWFHDSVRKVLDPLTNSFVPKIAKAHDKDEWAIVTTDYGTVRLYYGITAADFGAVEPGPGPDPNPPNETTIYLKAGDKVTIIGV